MSTTQHLISTSLAFLLGATAILFYSQQKADAALPGSAISYGQNPVTSIGGTAYDGETKVLFTAPADQDIIVTDLILTSYSDMDCKRNHKSEIILGSGAVLGQFETHSSISRGSYSSSAGLAVQHAFSSGVRIPANDTLTFVVTQTGADGSCSGTGANYGVRYMLSGYYAQM